jgi:AcrR family transcriptional regulator
MTVFWTRGYEGASLADLTAAMEINSPSLYACFGSKEGLFRAVLERYDARRGGFLAKVLAAPTAMEVATLFLEGVARFASDTGGRTPPGCLLLQSGMACGDKVIADEVARHRAEKEAALKTRFEAAKAESDLPKSADPAALARYLAAMANGMCVQAASGASAEDLLAVARLALASWPMGEKAGEKKPAKKSRRAPVPA